MSFAHWKELKFTGLKRKPPQAGGGCGGLAEERNTAQKAVSRELLGLNIIEEFEVKEINPLSLPPVPCRRLSPALW